MASIELQQIHKWFDTLHVINGVDLSIQKGEFVVFVGPSGCGKSTLLRIIAGLEDATYGSVLIDSEGCNWKPSIGTEFSNGFSILCLVPAYECKGKYWVCSENSRG